MSRTKGLSFGSDSLIIENKCSSFNRRFILFLLLAVFWDSYFSRLDLRLDLRFPRGYDSIVWELVRIN